MTFRFANGRVKREQERESYKVRQVGGRWLMVKARITSAETWKRFWGRTWPTQRRSRSPKS